MPDLSIRGIAFVWEGLGLGIATVPQFPLNSTRRNQLYKYDKINFRVIIGSGGDLAGYRA